MKAEMTRRQLIDGIRSRLAERAVRHEPSMKPNDKFPIHRAYYPYRNIDPVESVGSRQHSHDCIKCWDPVLCDLADCRKEYAICSKPSCAEPANVIYDGGDVITDDNGPVSWRGEPICCLECRETAPMEMWATRIYLVYTLNCSSCGQDLAEIRA